MANKPTVQRASYILFLLLILAFTTLSLFVNFKSAGAAGEAELAVSGAELAEGDSSMQSLNFLITRTHNADTIMVTATTQNDSAEAGTDYLALTQTVVFTAGGSLTATVPVAVLGDGLVEPDETFSLILSAPISATLAFTQATGTILNDDGATVSMMAGAASEAAGTLPYTLTLSAAASRPITVAVSSFDGSASDGDADYQPIIDEQIEFPAGTVTRTGQITLVNDSKVEADETFVLTISNLITNGLAISASSMISDVGSIFNDDSASVTLVAPPASFEGNSGLTPFVFTAKLDNPVDGGFQVAYQTDSGTADSATDFVDQAGTLTFSGTAGEEQTISVDVRGDLAVESTETFSVTFGAISGTTLGDQISVTTDSAIGTIIDDDAAGIFVSNGRVVETDLDTADLVFTVTLSTEIGGGFSVDYTSADGSAIAADGDYEPISGTLNFLGEAFEQQTITVTVNGDQIVEADEHLTVRLSNISSNDVAAFNSEGTGTIENNDSAELTLSEGLTITEGNLGQTTVPFTVTLTRPVQGGFRVVWSAVDGTATVADNDFGPANTQILFNGVEGETKTFDLMIQGDAKVELAESLTVQLDSLAGLIGVDPAAIQLPPAGRPVTILADDAATIALTGESKLEGTHAGYSTFVVTATLSAAVDAAVTVDFETISGTAQAGSDFVATNGSALFAGTAGETQTFEISVLADGEIEPHEAFTVGGMVSAADGRNVTMAADHAVATVTILDDDVKRLYLPLQYHAWRLVDGPDLIVSNLEIGPTSITVTIKNQGNEAVTRPFWVDSYINPKIVPTMVNQTIVETQSEGFVWGIDLDSNAQTARLPMWPGDEIVLTVGGTFYHAANSNFASNQIPAGSSIYVQVDSFNPNSTFGQVEESHEIAGFIYNNIFKSTAPE